MKPHRKIFLLFIVFIGLLAFWYWADKEDYFQADYRNLTATQEDIFVWQDGDGDNAGEKLMQQYRQHFVNSQYAFPPQKVTKLKLFRNTPIINVLTSKTLKQDYVHKFIAFCNDTMNFHWAETT